LRCSRPTIPSPPTPTSSSSDSSTSRNPPDRVATRRTRSARGRRPGRLTSDQATESGGQLRIVPLQRRSLGPQDESPVPPRCQSAAAECSPPHSPSSGSARSRYGPVRQEPHTACDRGPGTGQTRCGPEPPALVSAHQRPDHQVTVLPLCRREWGWPRSEPRRRAATSRAQGRSNCRPTRRRSRT
jgi:hypothetical protein